MGNEEKAPKGYPLRPTLVSLVVMLIVLTALSISLLASRTAERAITDLWTSLSVYVTQAADQSAENLFDHAPPFIRLAVSQSEANQLDTQDEMSLMSFQARALVANPNFSWITYAREDGVFVAVERVGGHHIGHLRRVGDNGTTSLRKYRHVKEGWQLQSDVVGDYDARRRPWYRRAVESKTGNAWVGPFRFATKATSGVSYVHTHRQAGRVAGVWSVEYELDSLSKDLQSLEVGTNGRVFIVDADGNIVAHSDDSAAFESPDIVHVEGCGDIPLQEAWKTLSTVDKTKLQRFSFGSHIALSSPIGDQPWVALVIVPEDDFFGEAKRLRWQALFIALFSAFLAVCLGIFLASRISGDLRQIADDLERIGKFDLSKPKASLRSHVREVNHMNSAASTMRKSLRSFGKYVPLEVVQQLMLSSEEATLGGKRRTVTVLFSDIRGFTGFSEKMDPDALVELLATYLEDMSNVIRDEGGTVDKYIGDAIMAFWGAPSDNESHALHACRGAWKMKCTLDELRARFAKQGLPDMFTRIGLNTGEALVGNIGAKDRMNYTAMGDAINLGARLEPLNNVYGTTILIGPDTADAAKEEFLLRPIDWVAVKGKKEAILVHELVGPLSVVSEEQTKATQAYQRGLQRYGAREFEDAIASFEEAQKWRSGDLAATLLIKRCRALVELPPGADWTPAISMSSK